MTHPEVVLILVEVIPLDVAIHTQFARRFAQYFIGVDIGMTLLEVVPVLVGVNAFEIAIRTEHVLVHRLAMSRNALSVCV